MEINPRCGHDLAFCPVMPLQDRNAILRAVVPPGSMSVCNWAIARRLVELERERDEAREDFLRVADALGLVSTDDTGRIGDVASAEMAVEGVKELTGAAYRFGEEAATLRAEVERLRERATKAAAELRHAYRERERIDPRLVARAIEILERAALEVKP